MALALKTKKTKHCVEYRAEDKRTGERTGEVLAKFWVMPMTPTEIDRMLDEYRYYEWDAPPASNRKERRSAQLNKQRFERYKNIEFVHARIKRTIEDWSDIVDENGKPIPCTDENKILVYELNPDVINYVLSEADGIGLEDAERTEQNLKNYKPSQSGSSAQDDPTAKDAESI